MVALLCKYVAQCTRMEGSHGKNNIIYRKGATQKTEMDRLFFLVAKGFNTNLVQFLNLYCRIMFFLVTCMYALLLAQFPPCAWTCM